jgi:amino acid transporter
MAEEVSNAQLTIPRAICVSMIFNGIFGFAMMVTVLYCLGDAKSVLNTPLPFIRIFYNSVKSFRGATVMSVVVVILTWLCATGITATASRMTWSFARDKGTPFFKQLKIVSKNQKIPIVAILVTTIFAALLVVIYVGSKVAFNDVISLTITGFYGSYFLPCAFLLYHRVKGRILPYGSQLPRKLEQLAPSADGTLDEEAGIQTVQNNEAETRAASDKGAEIQVVQVDDEIQAAPDKEAEIQEVPNEDEIWSTSVPSSVSEELLEPRFVWGPWHLPGILGTINNAYACVYMIYVIFWSFWPPATPVSAKTMNYSIVVTGGVLILSGVWYVVRGKREYKGPVNEVN